MVKKNLFGNSAIGRDSHKIAEICLRSLKKSVANVDFIKKCWRPMINVMGQRSSILKLMTYIHQIIDGLKTCNLENI